MPGREPRRGRHASKRPPLTETERRLRAERKKTRAFQRRMRADAAAADAAAADAAATAPTQRDADELLLGRIAELSAMRTCRVATASGRDRRHRNAPPEALRESQEARPARPRWRD